MSVVVIAMRLVHVTLGVFWAGAIFFFVIFLEPSVRAAGPDGASVMRGLQQRHYMNVLPIIAVLTILSGLWLYWRVSAGLATGWITSPVGLGLTSGGAAALLAFLVGFFVMRRSALQASKLGATLQEIPDGGERDAALNRIQALQRRARVSARWVAVLLAVAVMTMAVARYL